MDCNKAKNLAACNCTYEPCPRKGLCCQCLAYHRDHGELPACFFSEQAEMTFDRSIAAFLKDQKAQTR
jgi:hypothetical protein